MTDDLGKQAIIDEEHLRLLSLAYAVSAGLNAFCALFGLIYIVMGVLLMLAINDGAFAAGEQPPPAIVGAMFAIGGCLFAGGFLTLALLQFLVFRRLRARRSHAFCQVVAALSCLVVPVGTLLGVCTFLVLRRPSVAPLFAPAPH